MKVSVITIVGMYSYGSLLQMFATQKKLERYADEVEIVNRVTIHDAGVFINKARDPARRINYALAYYLRIRPNFQSFVKEHVNMSEAVYVTESDFEKKPPQADIYCTGSDQVWNLRHGTLPLSVRFLGYAPPDAPRFSYASSFGVERFTEQEAAVLKQHIKNYGHISVREDSGVKLLSEQCGRSGAVHLVDPTLAMPPEFWRGYAPPAKLKGDYILAYIVVNPKGFNRHIEELSQKTGLPVVQICNTPFQYLTGSGMGLFLPPVMDFITLIDNAKYILTDSFHGTAFALNLNTTPVCIRNRHPGRIDSLLRLVGEENRFVQGPGDLGPINAPIDFDRVNRVLDVERQRVDEFLRGVFR